MVKAATEKNKSGLRRTGAVCASKMVQSPSENNKTEQGRLAGLQLSLSKHDMIAKTDFVTEPRNPSGN